MMKFVFLVLTFSISFPIFATPTSSALNDAWFESARRGNLAQIKKLSDRTKVDAQNSAGETALILASEAASLDIVNYLLSKKANLNVQDKAGNTALIYALANRADEVALRLIGAGADVSLAGAKEGNAFNIAVKNGRSKVVENLAKSHPESLNQTNAEGETPIFSAIREAHFALAEKMIGLGSKIDVKNKKGESLLDVAKSSGIPQGHTLLKKLNSPVNPSAAPAVSN